MKYRELIARMSLEDKVALCSGADYWNTKAFEKYGIPAVTMHDGPHGLRKVTQKGADIGMDISRPATCFPPACATGCSWDRDLLRRIGGAIAVEALGECVGIVLGPGINIKRNPLCGRNFEYFSEDPCAAGELGAAFIQGVEGQGVGASLKHYAANSQEAWRFYCDSIVDERTLREIYLAGFERAVGKGKPSTVMCAYNKVNGVKCSDNITLMRRILRDQWGFGGVTVTDWGAMNDRTTAFEAGTDLEMPGGAGYFDGEVMEAVRSGRLCQDFIDEAVDRLLTLIFRLAPLKSGKYTYDAGAHHRLARRAACESAVLLKNRDGILPLDPAGRIAVVGHMARNIRYQGTGSSRVNPTRVVGALEAFDDAGVDYTYCEGCRPDGATTDELIAEAVRAAGECGTAVVFAGLPESFESEGFDRESLNLPGGHDRMIREVARANPRTVVVLMAGSVVAMPWLDDVMAVLHMHLPGQAGGQAAADLLLGAANPCGKLSESYPLSYDDVPSSDCYGSDGKQAQYREGLYVGYRYYDSAGRAVRFPFGYGLSYTTFGYSDLRVGRSGEDVTVTLSVTNTGKTAGAEIVQLYVGAQGQGIHRPRRELRGFEKVRLDPGESQRIGFTLDRRAFAYFDVGTGSWRVQAGRYEILAAASSRDIRLRQLIELEGDAAAKVSDRHRDTWYRLLRGKPGQKDLEALLGRAITRQPAVPKGSYTLDQCIMDMQDAPIMRLVYHLVELSTRITYGGDTTHPEYRMAMAYTTQAPMKNLCAVSSGTLKRPVAQGLVRMANGHFLRGLGAMMRG